MHVANYSLVLPYIALFYKKTCNFRVFFTNSSLLLYSFLLRGAAWQSKPEGNKIDAEKTILETIWQIFEKSSLKMQKCKIKKGFGGQTFWTPIFLFITFCGFDMELISKNGVFNETFYLRIYHGNVISRWHFSMNMS